MPYSVRFHLQPEAHAPMTQGALLSDVVANLGSLGVIAGELDR